jgi:hypothetical protein
MKLTGLTTLAFSLLLVSGSAATAGTAGGSAALALAGVVATYSPLLSSGEKKAVAAFFAGNSGFPYKNKITVPPTRSSAASAMSTSSRAPAN